MNLAMSRSRAWVRKGEEFIDRVPMNWGGNLTAIGAIRLSGFVALSTMFATANKDRFVRWLRVVRPPKLVVGDIISKSQEGLPGHRSRVRRMASC